MIKRCNECRSEMGITMIMPNIPMRLNSDCLNRRECYRFKGTPNPRKQRYEAFKPDKGRDRCDKFMPLYRADKGDV